MNGGVGTKQTASLLNKTLEHIVSLLEKNDITEWFLGYGTLLGIVRNNSCIEGDDDIDIIINNKYIHILHKIAKEHHFKIVQFKKSFIRFIHPDYAAVDFYLATFKNKIVMDKWENTKWTDVFPLIQIKWKGVTLQLPNQHIKNLKNRYGRTWRTPKKYKGKHGKTVKKPFSSI
jgi:phosphorylcholine metabolism protein LicD